jgi:hypothetical protein
MHGAVLPTVRGFKCLVVITSIFAGFIIAVAGRISCGFRTGYCDGGHSKAHESKGGGKNSSHFHILTCPRLMPVVLLSLEPGHAGPGKQPAAATSDSIATGVHATVCNSAPVVGGRDRAAVGNSAAIRAGDRSGRRCCCCARGRAHAVRGRTNSVRIRTGCRAARPAGKILEVAAGAAFAETTDLDLSIVLYAGIDPCGAAIHASTTAIVVNTIIGASDGRIHT